MPHSNSKATSSHIQQTFLPISDQGLFAYLKRGCLWSDLRIKYLGNCFLPRQGPKLELTLCYSLTSNTYNSVLDGIPLKNRTEKGQKFDLPWRGFESQVENNLRKFFSSIRGQFYRNFTHSYFLFFPWSK